VIFTLETKFAVLDVRLVTSIPEPFASLTIQLSIVRSDDGNGKLVGKIETAGDFQFKAYCKVVLPHF